MDNKLGVYICSGCDIGKYLNIEKLENIAKNEYKPEICRANDFLCSKEGLNIINEDIKSSGVNKIVIAACSMRSKQDVFSFDLSKIFTERVNLREHVIWVSEPNSKGAQMLAEDYLRMGIARAKKAEITVPLAAELNKTILVVGGGVTGLTAALNSAKAGYDVILIEKKEHLGGFPYLKYKKWETSPPFENNLLIKNDLGKLIDNVESSKKIKIYKNSEISEISGAPGKFEVKIKVKTSTNFRLGSGSDFDSDKDIKDKSDISKNDKNSKNINEETVIEKAGAIIVATGWKPYDAHNLSYLGYGLTPDILTNVELEELYSELYLKSGDEDFAVKRKSDGKDVKSVAFILCAGSRDENYLPYCSTVCCMTSLKEANLFRKNNPDAKVYIIYRDIRTPGEYENYYKSMQNDDGIFMVKGIMSDVSYDGKNNTIKLKVNDTLFGGSLELDVDMVILASGMVPNSGNFTANDEVISADVDSASIQMQEQEQCKQCTNQNEAGVQSQNSGKNQSQIQINNKIQINAKSSTAAVSSANGNNSSDINNDNNNGDNKISTGGANQKTSSISVKTSKISIPGMNAVSAENKNTNPSNADTNVNTNTNIDINANKNINASTTKSSINIQRSSININPAAGSSNNVVNNSSNAGNNANSSSDSTTTKSSINIQRSSININPVSKAPDGAVAADKNADGSSTTTKSSINIQRSSININPAAGSSNETNDNAIHNKTGGSNPAVIRSSFSININNSNNSSNNDKDEDKDLNNKDNISGTSKISSISIGNGSGKSNVSTNAALSTAAAIKINAIGGAAPKTAPESTGTSVQPPAASSKSSIASATATTVSCCTTMQSGSVSTSKTNSKGGLLNLTYRQGKEMPDLIYGFPDSNFICFPYESRRTGIYPAGSVRAPMDTVFSVDDAKGAVLKAIQCIEQTSKGRAVHPRSNDTTYPFFDLQRCTQCKRCTEECPFGAIDEDEKGTPKPNPERCRRCGVCMGACPVKIISFKNYSVDIIGSMLKSINVPGEAEKIDDFRILVFACENDAYPALDIAGMNKIQLPSNIRVIPVRCLGSINNVWYADALSRGIDGILLLGCKFGDDYQCHFIKGSELASYRMENLKETLTRLVLESERIKQVQLEFSDYKKLPDILNEFADKIKSLGSNPYKEF
jgi:heterodisulfide reductase subunit A-like polyferredoxin/coenzyme F420-reducing hydrogenase delta subunit